MAAVEIFFHRVLTDDRWMNQAACKGLTHLFFPPPAERPQARDRREAAAKSVCASLHRSQRVPGVRQDEPRVRVLGWRERGRAPLRRLPPDRPDRRASPQRRLTQRLRSPHERRDHPPPGRRRGMGRRTATTQPSSASTRSAPTSRPTASTDCTSTTARRSSARSRRTVPTSCSSRITSSSTAAPACSGSTRFNGMLADIWSRDGRIFTWYDQHMWAVFYDDVPRRDSLPRVLVGRADRQPGDGDGRVPPRLHRHRPVAAERVEDDQERRHPPARSAGEPVRATQLRPAAGGDRRAVEAHPPLPRAAGRGRLRRVAEDPDPDRLEPRQLLGRHRRPTDGSACSADGTTTGSASSRACSTSTSCRACRAAPATAPGSPTARTRWSSRRSSRSSTPTAACSR